MRLLILGGYGTFGGRLARLLAGEEKLTLMIAGRSASKAKAFTDSLRSGATKIAVAFDRDAGVEEQLRSIGPDLVVDATGPFQLYGEDPYRVVKACLACDIGYLDLADDPRFVAGIAQFDAGARARAVSLLSGVSTFPVLTAAVVRALARDLTKVTDVSAGIAPSPYAGVGLNVIRAISGYAGKAVPLLREGRRAFGHALTESMRCTIAPPGYLPLNNIRFSLVDVPDLQVFPQLWPELRSIWIGAGPVPAVLHRMLSGLAWLVRLRLLPSLNSLAPLFHYVSNTFRWGEHRGGMFVAVRGTDAEGRSVERSWHLVAEGDDGPYIPCMAAEAIVRRSLAGVKPAAGARPCIEDVELHDYEQLFRSRAIHTGRREETSPHAHIPLYRRILGDAWHALPQSLKDMHDCHGELVAEGVATVERGRGMLSFLAASIARFPRAAERIPVRVSFRETKGGELWRRTFGEKSFESFQIEGKGRSERLLSERFGPAAFDMALVLEDGKIVYVVRRWSYLGVPLPAAWAPTGRSYEFVADGRFNFHVEIAHPLTGLIVRYSGWLAPRHV